MSASRAYTDHDDPFSTYDPSYPTNTPTAATTPYLANAPRNESTGDLATREVDLGSASRGPYVGVPLNDSQYDLRTHPSGGSPFPSSPGGTGAYNSATPSPSSSHLNLPAMNQRGYSDNGSSTMMAKAPGMAPSSSILDSGPSPWLLSQQRRERRSKMMIWGCALVTVGLIIVGVVVGIVVSNNKKDKTDSNTQKAPSVVKQDDPNDPSSFVKDSRLHQAFYGIAYTPDHSQLPWCGNTLPDIIQDIQLLSQLTKRIRLYGADCNQTELVLEAIQQTKVDMEVFLGNYPIATDNGQAYRRQRDAIKSAIQKYGTKHIAGITVGNEFMLNYVDAQGLTDANSAAADTGAAILIANIKDTRDMLTSMNLDKNIPVGTSDAGSYFNDKVLAEVDYGLANVHPWFAQVSAEESAGWTATFFEEVDIAQANKLSNKPHMYIAETGWPTKSSDATKASNGASTASVANLQIFLDTFVCAANTNGTGYFFFEFFDEPWKDAQFGGVEGWWGLFTADRQLKNVTIPTCTAP